MMKSIITYYLICIFLCAPFLIKASTNKADSLYKIGKYKDAYLEYEKIIFNSNDLAEKNYALLNKSKCYKQLEKFNKAFNTLQRIVLYGIDDTFHCQIRYESALNAYLAGNYIEAESQINYINNFIKDSILKQNSSLIQVLIFNENNNWDEAKKQTFHYINSLDIPNDKKNILRDSVNLFYSKKHLPKIKNPKKAQLLSTFIPGTGQMYAGYPLEGIYNLTLHLVTLGFAAEEIYFKYYLTGYFGGFAIFQKFYFGSSKRAEYLARKNNYEEKKKFNETVENFLLRQKKSRNNYLFRDSII